MAKKPNRLGRGLNSLISSSLTSELHEHETSKPDPAPSPSKPKRIEIDSASPNIRTESIVGRLAQLEAAHDDNASTNTRGAETSVLAVAVDAIIPNKHQPRRVFDPVSISRLARSIAESGILQPLLVRRIENPSADSPTFELIAGERRLRAAKAAGIESVPAILKSIDAQTSMEFALVENIQREDLNAIDRARAYRVYCDRTGFSTDEASRRLGEDRSTIANYLRLLDLTPTVTNMVESGQLSMGHARALLGAPDEATQETCAKQAVSQGLSVRAVEALVKTAKTTRIETPAKPSERADAHLADMEGKLQQAVQTKVQIKPGRAQHRGKIIIDYYSLDDFDRIATKLGYTEADSA